MKRAIWLLLVVALQSSCQTTVVPFTPGSVEDTDNALVYVYWPGQRWAEKSGESPEVQLDGVPVGVLHYKTYLELEVAAGEHELRMTGASDAADWNGVDQHFNTPLQGGEVKYVRLLVKFDQNTNNLSEGLMSHVVQFLPRSEGQARIEMADLKEARD